MQVIKNITVDSFGTKIVSLEDENGKIEYVSADEGQWQDIENELKQKGVL